MTAATAFRHDEIFVGFSPIDELHREFQYLLDLLIDCEDADYGQHLVDLQRGEVEWRGGNLYFDQWDYQFEWTVLPRDGRG